MREKEAREETLREDVASRRNATILSGAGAILSAFLGGRSTVTKLSRVARSVGGIQSRQASASRAGDRLEELRERLSDHEEEMARLEQDLAATLVEIDERWAASADRVETLTIGLETSDVVVDEVALVWVPVD